MPLLAPSMKLPYPDNRRPSPFCPFAHFMLRPFLSGPASFPTASALIIIENLIRILQYRIHDPDLPSRVRDVSTGRRAHERGSKDDSQILRVHPVGRGLLRHPVQM
jgi:hypothetical protein